MLTTEVFEAALPLTDKVDSANVILKPMSGTPLEALCKFSPSDLSVLNKLDTGGYEPDIHYLAMAASSGDAFGVNQHDITMTEIVNVAVDAVRAQITLARTQVTADIGELVERTQKSMADTTAGDLVGMEIISVAAPAPLIQVGMDNLVRQFEGVALDSPVMAFSLPTLDVTQIKELLTTGSGGFDQAIAEWLSIKGDNYVIDSWAQFFQIVANSVANVPPLSFSVLLDNDREGVDNALFVFLAARKIYEAGLPAEAGPVEMNLKALEALSVVYRDQAGARLVRALKNLDNIVNNGVLIKKIDGRKIYVNEIAYRPWILAGGNNDVLFGNVLDDSPNYLAKNIDDKKDIYLQRWNRYVSTSVTTNATKKFLRTKEIMLQHYNSMLLGADQTDPATAQNRIRVVEKFEALLDTLSMKDFDDLYSAAMKLVCRSRYPDSAAEVFLTMMEEAARQNPHLAPRECATIATMRYITRWVAAQIEVDPKR